MPSCSSCATEVAADVAFCPRCGLSLNDPLLGTVIGDRYRIVARIGTGGMGAVYRAEHTMMRRDLAIKVLLPELGGKDEFARRFVREAESASRLTHPNIITVTDFGRTPDGLLFLVMEYLAGGSLTSLIRKGPVPLGRALVIMRQILAALRHAHGAGVIHRDLKPDNIMLVERDGRADVVKILDFGIAKVSEPLSGQGGHEALTQAGVIFGTPEYLSPEQAVGEAVDARADLYAAGVILFEMLVGRRPFEAPDKVRVISMHLSHPLPRMRDVNPNVDVPLEIEEVVVQALEKQRENRFMSAGAFLNALDDAQTLVAARTPTLLAAPAPSGANRTGFADTAISLNHPTPPLSPALAPVTAPAQRFPRRRRFMLAVGALSLIGVIVIVAAVLGRNANPLSSPPARPVAAAPAVQAQLRRVEELLVSGELVKSRLAAEQLLAENPRNARVRYLLGRLAFAENRRGDALANYRTAIELDAGYRGDAVLLEHLGAALGEARTADEALDLAIERVGQPATSLLVDVANNAADVRRRERAARALDGMGERKRVDWVALRIAQLKKAPTCEDRKPLVVELGEAGDLRALPVLRAQRSRGGLSRFFGSEDSSCMSAELADAIANLEAKLPPEKRPPAKPSPRRSSSSLLRGR